MQPGILPSVSEFFLLNSHLNVCLCVQCLFINCPQLRPDRFSDRERLLSIVLLGKCLLQFTSSTHSNQHFSSLASHAHYLY